jgi:amidase
MGPACSIDTIYGDRWGDVFLTSPAAISGYPITKFPGKVYDLPVFLSFSVNLYSEPELIGYASEQASKVELNQVLKNHFSKLSANESFTIKLVSMY